MAVVFNHMQDWIYALKELSCTSKLVLQRLISMSNDGKRQVYMSRQTYSDELGIDPSSLTRAFKQLESMGFIEPVKNPNPFNKTKNFKITSKALFNRELQNATIEHCDEQQSNIENSNDGELQNKELEHCKKQSSSLDRNIYIKDRSIVKDKTNTSSSPSTQFSIEKIENDALYLQNIFTEEIMKLAKRNVEARNVSSFVESEKWLRWNRENDKLKYIKSEKRLRELVSSWVLRSLEKVVTHPEVTNQEDLTEKRQAFLASLKY